MTSISQLGALELEVELRAASDSYNLPLVDALAEVARLREVIQDAIDLINTDAVTYRDGMATTDYFGLMKRIEDGLQRYFQP